MIQQTLEYRLSVTGLNNLLANAVDQLQLGRFLLREAALQGDGFVEPRVFDRQRGRVGVLAQVGCAARDAPEVRDDQQAQHREVIASRTAVLAGRHRRSGRDVTARFGFHPTLRHTADQFGVGQRQQNQAAALQALIAEHRL